jgi:hypothetical protein
VGLVRQLFTTRKWLLTHVAVIGAVLLFLGLGFWQLRRGESGNVRSYAYSLEWPSFALLVLGFWAKIIYDELRPKSGPDRQASASGEPGAPLTAAGALTAGRIGENAHPPDRSAGARAAASIGAGVTAGASSTLADAGGDDDPELAAYNRYLAELASNGRR